MQGRIISTALGCDNMPALMSKGPNHCKQYENRGEYDKVLNYDLTRLVRNYKLRQPFFIARN